MIDYQNIPDKQKLLDQFDELLADLASHYPLKKLGNYIYILGPQKKNEKVSFTFTGIIHGDEPSGFLLILELLKFLKSFKPTLNFSMGLALGNFNAFLANKRFLETDLNRSFSSPKVDSLEQKRAVELSQLLSQTKILIDFHQTIQPSHYPFFIFPFTKRGLALAHYLATDLPFLYT
jgi:succinylglutamate desuccinylase